MDKKKDVINEINNFTDEDRILIKKKFTLLKRLLRPMNEEEIKVLEKAYRLSYEAHKGIRRHGGLPYIVHPIHVALILVEEIGIKDITTIVCALLHDVVEDTGITIAQIRQKFGKQVAVVIDGLTKIVEPSEDNDWVNTQSVNFQKFFSFFSKDIRICPIKIADRLDNMRSLDVMPKHKQLKTAYETKLVYAPLAHRLGFGKAKSDLEDLYLKYVHPEIYARVAKRIQLKKPEREKAIRDFARPIIRELKKENIKFRTEMRIKSIYSIYDKMHRKNIAFDQIYDLFGLRVILDYSKNEEIAKCWGVYGIITRLYSINPQRTKDWVSNPRSNGYKSLHMHAMSNKGEWVEVQIRSELMHKVDTQGIAAHWKYKPSDQKELSKVVQYEKMLNEMSSLAKQKANVTEALQDAQLALYERDIYVFTEMGKRIFFPKGATVLDYAIQTMGEKGVYCKRGIIDGKTQSRDYKLKNGEQINAIHVNFLQKLQPEWTRLTHTAKARKVWKEVFSSFSSKKNKIGKRIVQRELNKSSIELSPTIEHQLKNFFRQENIDHVYYKIGSLTIPSEVLQDFIKMKEREQKNRKRYKSSLSEQKKHIVITGEDSEVYELATCCSPLPGDSVFGIVPHTKSTIDIHLLSCKEAPFLIAHYGSSLLEVTWQHTDQIFERCISFSGIVNIEARKKIILLIQEFDVLSFMLNKINDRSKGTIILNVHNVHELQKLMEEIKKVEGIMDVIRDTLPQSRYIL